MNLTTRSYNGPPEVRLAATVVPLRDAPDGLEVLMTIRPRSMRFMGGMAVFPGGALDPADHDERWEALSAVSGAEATALLGLDDPREALGIMICALRESYEEVGLLLATGAPTGLSQADAGDAAAFLSGCLAAGLTLATDALVPAGRWVTPPGPIRFDARFFVARVPDFWEPVPDPGEVESCLWVTPAVALEAVASGDMVMAPPTIEMLQRLAAYEGTTDSLDGLAKDSRQRGGIMSVPLSDTVRVVLAPNPGIMTGPGTNAYVVGSGPVVVIDPAVDDPAFLEVLLRGEDVAAILVTHRHPDHTGGIAAAVARTAAPVRAFGTEEAGGVQVDPIEDGGFIEAGSIRLRALHTPGHASDHLCFFDAEASVLFAGDNILGEGTAVIAPPDGDMGAFIASLTRLNALGVERIYPGHSFPLDDGDRVIGELLVHRAAREAAILASLSDGPLSVPEIVERVYTDTAPHLHALAEYSVRAHLELAETKGATLRDGDRWRLVREAGSE